MTGRLGYTWGPALLYVKGGYAYSDNNEFANAAGAPAAVAFSGDHRNGYTVGAGSEYMFAQNWSAKIEYQFTISAPPRSLLRPLWLRSAASAPKITS